MTEFDGKTLKDFEYKGEPLLERAKTIDNYIVYRHNIRHLPYRIITCSGSEAEMEIQNPYRKKQKMSLVLFQMTIWDYHITTK